MPWFHNRPSQHVDLPEESGWQGKQASDDLTQTQEAQRRFPGYADYLFHDRNEDFDLPGIMPAPSPVFDVNE